MVMGESDQTELGRAFGRALKRSEYTGASFAREMGVNAQNITHWQKRGVASSKALKASRLLGVSPQSISKVDAEIEGTIALTLTPSADMEYTPAGSEREALELALSELSASQIVEALEAADLSAEDAAVVAHAMIDRLSSARS